MADILAAMSRKVIALAAGAGVLAGAAGVAAWARARLVAISVDGFSMSPSLYPRDRVLVRRGIFGLRRGRIVVVARPHTVTGWRGAPPAIGDLNETQWFIKRVVAVAGDPYPAELRRSGTIPSGHVAVLGDHPHSEDSKQYGPCPVDQILGVQVRKLASQAA